MSELFNIPLPQDISNEWYTPAIYAAAARKVMGTIDLDPASCAVANQIIGAKHYYSQEQNGLLQDWSCCSMWLNPPYGTNANGKSNMAVWTSKLLEEYAAGHVEQAILLCMSNTEASWFEPLWSYPICFPCPRVMFHRPSGKLDHHIQGTCFVYLGSNRQKFIDTFCQFGTVAGRINTIQQKYTTLNLWNNNDVTRRSEEVAG